MTKERISNVASSWHGKHEIYLTITYMYVNTFFNKSNIQVIYPNKGASN